MRVLYFSRDYTTHDRRFLAALAPAHEVFFLRLENDGFAREGRPLPAGVTAVDWRGGREPAKDVGAWLGVMDDLERVLHDVRPDLIHAGPVQSCGFLAALTGFQPLLVASWGSDMLVDADRDDMWRWITRFTLRRTAMALSDCNAVTRRMLAVNRDLSGRVIQFPWGIDLKRFAPGPDRAGLRQQLGLEDRTIVLSTRAWEPVYATETLLQAFRVAHQLDPRLGLLLLGQGTLASAVRAFAAEPGVADAVRVAGTVSQDALPDYFRAADVYLSCAPQDGSSISLIEAMASGLPVVVTEAEGNKEWVTDGINGWLVPASDVPRWSRGILEATGLDPERRKTMGHRNRALAESRANWDRNVRLLLDGYERSRAVPPGATTDAGIG